MRTIDDAVDSVGKVETIECGLGAANIPIEPRRNARGMRRTSLLSHEMTKHRKSAGCAADGGRMGMRPRVWERQR